MIDDPPKSFLHDRRGGDLSHSLAFANHSAELSDVDGVDELGSLYGRVYTNDFCRVLGFCRVG